ncbi:MAG: HTH-type transcriptional repressor FabR [Hahellaceae bacterium]|nr:HTH-type transcriptional repressor FabR [Hahellaceae bacterium]
MAGIRVEAPKSRPVLGRRAVISREDLIKAAVRLVGPNRSVSTLSLREVARQAGIAPNSFYRHFRDVDELAVTLVDEAGRALREIIGEARQRAESGRSVVRSSVEVFMKQLDADEPFLPLLLREGTVGSPAFKAAAERQLQYFEEELQADLVRLAALRGETMVSPHLVAKAVTRLVFTMGSSLLDMPREQHDEFRESLVIMIRMILTGAEVMARGIELGNHRGPSRQ